MFSSRCIFSATTRSRSMYPLYFMRISAASAISSFRLLGRSSTSFNCGIISERLLRFSWGRLTRSTSLHPNWSGVVPSASREVLISFGFIAKLLQKVRFLRYVVSSPTTNRNARVWRVPDDRPFPSVGCQHHLGAAGCDTLLWR